LAKQGECPEKWSMEKTKLERIEWKMKIIQWFKGGLRYNGV
jgi:hypothetical protein